MRKPFVVFAAALVILATTPLANGLVPSAGAAPLPPRVLAGQTPDVVVKGRAVLRGHHDPAALLTLNIGLKVRDSAGLDALIAAAGDPANPAYGHYLTNDQYLARFAPLPQDALAVRDWATSAGLTVDAISPDNLLMTVKGTTALVERALNVKINDYSLSGRVFMSNDRDPSVPGGLQIRAISGLTTIHRFHTLLSRGAALRPGGYYPNDFRAAYNMGPVGDGSGQTIGLTLWGTSVAQSDLNTFASRSSTTALVGGQAGANGIDWIPVNGGSSDTHELVETAMDVEYTHGVAPNSHLKYWLADCAFDGVYCNPSDVGLELAISDAANDGSVHVVSNSWGGGEATSLNDPFVSNTNASFQHAAGVGTTFYFSSGDSGSNSGGTGLPSYPTDSPYVVSVGGTTLNTGTNFAYSSESAWGGSGGGCSSVFARPSWQTGIGAATCSGRAVPDISADADPNSGADVYVQGVAEQVGGTSLSAPLWAGMAADLNRYLGANSQPLMGFSATRLYQLANNATTYGRDFHDVTAGYTGFSAGPGWDQATGWGSANLANLAADWPAGGSPTSTPTNSPVPATNTPTRTNTPAVPTNTPAPPTNTPTAGAGGGWVGQSSGTANSLRAIACASATTCEVAGVNGTILGTTNGGSTWSVQSSGTTNWLYGLACASSTVCTAVGGGGAIRATTNGGATWVSQSSGVTTSLRAVACPSTTVCIAVGDGGVIRATSNGGATWSPLNGGTNTNLSSVACPSASVCFVSGAYGVILSTANGGSNWTVQALGTAQTLFGLACASTSVCTAVGGGGMIRATTNGVNWTAQNSGTTNNLTGVSCASTSTCTAVGVNGTILGTANGGSTWGAQSSGVAVTLYGAAAPGTSVAYAVGDNGTILKNGAGAPPTNTPTTTPAAATGTATRTPVPPTATATPSATSTPTSGGAASGSFSGTINTSGGSDSTPFTPGVSGTAAIGMCATYTANDFDLYVYDSSNNLLGSSTSPSNCEWLSLPLSAGQTYTIKTVSFNGTGIFRWAWSVNGAKVVWNVSGSIPSAGGGQYFSFPILHATDNIALSTCGPSGSDFDLYLTNAAYAVLASSTSPSNCESLSLTPGSLGLYRLEEVSFTGTGAWSGTITTR